MFLIRRLWEAGDGREQIALAKSAVFGSPATPEILADTEAKGYRGCTELCFA